MRDGWNCAEGVVPSPTLIETRETTMASETLLTQRAAAALFATAILVVVTFTTVNPLDASLQSAAHFFAWSAALLGGVLILTVTDTLPLLSSSLYHRLFHYALFASGGFTWLRGAYYVLLHYHVPGLEIVGMQTVVVVSICVMASTAQSSLAQTLKPFEALHDTLAQQQKTFKALQETLAQKQQIIDALMEVQQKSPAEAEPKPHAEGEGDR